MKKPISISFSLIILTVLVSFGQKKEYDLSSLFQQQKITIHNRKATLLKDKEVKGIKLNENSGEGIVWLNDVTFSTGILEIDLRGQDIFQRSFLGIAFHEANDSTYDAIYFRPFNFHAKDSIRKIHAVQYISHPVYTWKKLREEHNGTYEKALINPPNPNGWFHVRVEVNTQDVKVYVNKDSTPSLTVKKISLPVNGKVGIWVGDGSGGEFTKLHIISSTSSCEGANDLMKKRKKEPVNN